MKFIVWGAAAHVACLMALAPITALAASVTPLKLKCEGLVCPLGVEATHPCFSWQIQSNERNQRQSAYEIRVASRKGSLARGDGDLWDTGKILSDETVAIPYSGKRLHSGEQCFWTVRAWDKNGHASAWSESAMWSMGLLGAGDWAGSWIGLDQGESASPFAGAKWVWYPEGNPAVQAPLGTRFFRRDFELPQNMGIASGVIIITADNEFRVFVNGREAGSGSNWMNPRQFPITRLLRPGRNVLAVEARNVGGAPNPAGLIAQLKVTFEHGKPLTLDTDDMWRAGTTSEIGWQAIRFDDATWNRALVLGAYGIQPWGKTEDANRRRPARYLRREFTVKKKVRRATAYVCGLGFFNLFLNGQKVSDDMMDPALSEYSKAAYYVTFDVTDRLKRGDNAIAAVLGNGRFFAPRQSVPIQTESFGFPKLLLQMNIEYADGTTSQVVSDGHWKLTTHGPIRANNEYDGEEYDARLEMPGWDRAGFNDSKWEPARDVAGPGGELKSQMIEPMRVTQVLHPVAVTQPKPGTYIVDMGQNFYGVVRLNAAGARGSQVRLVTAYSLKPDGTLKTADNRSALSTDLYTFKGSGTEVWNPVFRGQGFRRIQVTGFPGKPTAGNFEGLVVHTAVDPVGEFQCSNDLVNRIHKAMRWGMRMFLRSAPLDPDRDERQAWNGDPAKDAESDAYNFNVGPFYAKWMDDVERSQRVDGSLPDVTMYWTGGAGVEWPSVFTIIPDWFFDFYGDRRIAATHYAAMKRWVLAMRRYELPDGTLQATSYGDWCDTSTMGGLVSDNGSTPRELVSSAYQYHNYRIMERLAKSLGHESDAQAFAHLADKLKAAFNHVFLDPVSHTYRGKTQCGYVLAIKFGLTPDAQRSAVIANLVDDILVKHQGHLSVGLIGMQWLMQTLTEIGRPDVAWTIATQTTRPSWGYMLAKGATTIWERWDYDTRDPGMNSEALLIQAGNLDAWFYQTLAGIRPAAPGFRKILIKPEPVGDLTWARGSFESVHGRIASEWHRANGRFDLRATIPANTTATIYLPARRLGAITDNGQPIGRIAGVNSARMEGDRAVIEVGSGRHHFSSTASQ